MASPEMYRLRARIAAGTRHHPDHPELIEPDQRELKTLRAEDYIRDLVESAPPLTAEQRARLARILNARQDVA